MPLRWLKLLGCFLLVSGSAHGDDVVVLPVAPLPATVRGVWEGELAIAGVDHHLAIVLHDRADGDLMGYVLGGTDALAMTGGLLTRSRVSIGIELASPTGVETFEIRGRVRGDEIVGRMRDGRGSSPVRLQRAAPAGLGERRFLVAEIDGGEPGDIVDIGLLLDAARGFLGGSYSGRGSCGSLGCAGTVTDYRDSFDTSGNPVVDLGLESGGSCPGSGSVRVTFDPALRLYTGAFDFTDCEGDRAGPMLGSGLTRTMAADALEMLGAYGRIADDLERGAVFGAPYAPFAPDYLHRSETLQARLDELNEQVDTYDTLDVDLARFRNLHTVDDPFIFPDLHFGFGVDFHDLRQGTIAGETFVYRDAGTRQGNDELRFLADRASGWVIHGNQISHDIPFAGYSFGPDNVVVPTAGGNVFVSVGTWGAHSGPHTGHLEGNEKADWIGQYAHRLSLLTELAGNGNGICSSGEICGFPEAFLLARNLDYVAPADNFEVFDVLLESIELPGVYYGGLEHWRIRAALGYYTFDFVHLRQVSPDLRDAMVAAGYTDPWTVHAPSDNLITGAPVALSLGQSVARPQIVASPVPGYPGYFDGGGPIGPSPWQQIEFFTRNNLTSRSESFYTWLASGLREQLATVQEAEGLNPISFRYTSPFLAGLEFVWLAEMALSNQEFSDTSDYSTIFTGLGGWWEGLTACDGVSVDCDELFSIFPIRNDTAFYDASLYDHDDVAYLAIHRLPGDPAPAHHGEVTDPSEPDPVSGTMVIKWRDSAGTPIGYQGVAYRLDPTAEALRIRWGGLVATEEMARSTVPAVPGNAEACDGTVLTCHDHEVKGR